MKKTIAILIALVLSLSCAAALATDEAFDTEYTAGQYKIGMDMPAGEYILLNSSAYSSYFCVSKDANGNDIIFNGKFDVNSIVTVNDGEYLELTRCYAVPSDDFYAVTTINLSEPGTMLAVGKDIEAGEYKLTQDSDYSAYYCIYPDSRQENIIANDNFEGSTYVAVKDGQYLELTRCIIQQ